MQKTKICIKTLLNKSYNKRKWIFISICFNIILCLFTLKIYPKSYTSVTSFIITQHPPHYEKENILYNTEPLELSHIKTNQLKIDRKLKSKFQKNSESQIIPLINSNLIKRFCYNKLITENKNLSLNSLEKDLQLKKKINITKNKQHGIYTIRYKHTNKETAKQVLSYYIKGIFILNERLGLIPERKIITIIDSPYIIKNKIKNTPLLYCFFTIFITYSLWFIYLLLTLNLKKIIHKISQKENKKAYF